MPNINSMMPSKYLKKEDVPDSRIVTIRRLVQDNVAQQGQPEEKKWVMHFDELENGLVMNNTNLQLGAQALGSDDTDDWIGKQIVLYADPNVTFGGKLVGGLRLRAVRRKTPATPARPSARPMPPEPPDTPFDDMDSDPIPF